MYQEIFNTEVSTSACSSYPFIVYGSQVMLLKWYLEPRDIRCAWVKVFRIASEFRIFELTFRRNSGISLLIFDEILKFFPELWLKSAYL